MEENLEKPEVQTNVVKSESKGLSIAALVLGIVALAFCFVWFISIPCAIMAVIFGILGVKKSGRGMAISGIVTGAISLVITTIIIILAVVTVKTAADYLTSNDFKDEWNSIVQSYDVTLDD